MCVHSHYNWRMNLELRSWLQTGITCNYLRTKTHIGCADPLSKVPGHLPYTLQGTPGSPSHPLTGPWSPKLCRCSATLLTPENERRFKWAHLSLTKPSRQDEVMKRLGVNNSVFHIHVSYLFLCPQDCAMHMALAILGSVSWPLLPVVFHIVVNIVVLRQSWAPLKTNVWVLPWSGKS